MLRFFIVYIIIMVVIALSTLIKHNHIRLTQTECFEPSDTSDHGVCMEWTDDR